ncbi:PREDICTED: uncharacterized protein LOC105558450 [Vollenhovia emeryi]|uniref:uncharacterized protein LOC105558450 n=1 Tax=Vollenhovia emeryi TaxID=411798 RepID=UPI0005F3A536|nr:PREDICTED: uncharacterized protein LOC105558450 [Vollenhovia emeryi]
MYYERETRGMRARVILEKNRTSRWNAPSLKVFVDDRLYTTNTNAEFSRNVSNIHPTVLQNELFYAANVVWCDAGSQSTIMRLILDGFAAIFERFGPFKNSRPTQALTTELISQTPKNFRVFNAFPHQKTNNNTLRNGGRHLTFTHGRITRVKRAFATKTMPHCS